MDQSRTDQSGAEQKLSKGWRCTVLSRTKCGGSRRVVWRCAEPEMRTFCLFIFIFFYVSAMRMFSPLAAGGRTKFSRVRRPANRFRTSGQLARGKKKGGTADNKHKHKCHAPSSNVAAASADLRGRQCAGSQVVRSNTFGKLIK